MTEKETLLSDYRPPVFLVDTIAMDVDIRPSYAKASEGRSIKSAEASGVGGPDHAQVTTTLAVRRNPKSKEKNAPLFLNGENQKLLSLKLDGREVKGKDFRFSDQGLTLFNVSARAAIEIVSSNEPAKNTALSGLYASGPMLVTQCEAEGFRRITYFPDRPDVMAKFTVTIHANCKKFPTLLSNGNLIASGKEGKDRHWARWQNPYPMPCYLFALVAGKFDRVADRFKTRTGRNVLVEIYTESGKAKETGFARVALRKAMKWDEKRFGLSYDLDRFMIVATPFFNMGAMENKGLNIFNDSCVLGRPETATDGTISFIERVVGHEYFHNWTGDRVTCRDWFQLSLKEGLTVFREQEFCGDMNSIPVERLGNIADLRRRQFAEDASPMAHPVRPDRYKAIDNFYTATVYDKGAEVCRMIQTLVGVQGFRKGMDLYFKRHDGQAVTCDDFVDAMSDANKIDLSQFMLWYSQAGTPVLRAQSRYDAKKKILRLTVRQSCPPTPGQKKKKPMHIPLAIGLLDEKGRDLIGTKILSLKKPREEFTFKNMAKKPVLSLLRDFSAPVKLVYPQSDSELLFLLAHDSDPFNRWEAGQKLLKKYLLQMIGSGGKKVPAQIKKLADALGDLLRDPPTPKASGDLVHKPSVALAEEGKKLDAAFKAFALSLPSEVELGLALQESGQAIDPAAIYAARKSVILALAGYLRRDLEAAHSALRTLSPTASDGISMGKRSLRNLCLAYLAAGEDEKILPEVFKQATGSNNMTDQVSALSILADTNSPLRPRAFAVFEKRWKKNQLVMDRWLSVQAAARRKGVLRDVEKLLRHPAFDFKNPNRVSALIGVFAGNSAGFHAADGSGYRFVGETIAKLDPVNPHSAAGLARAYLRWRDYEPKRRAMMRKELEKLSRRKLSPNCHEIVARSLKNS